MGISGLPARALISCTAHELPSGSRKPKNVPPSASVTTLSFARRDAKIEQFLPCRRRVRNDELKSLHRARRHLVLGWQIAEDDRTARPRRGQLRDVHVLVLGVVIQSEADLVAIKHNRTVDIANR